MKQMTKIGIAVVLTTWVTGGLAVQRQRTSLPPPRHHRPPPGTRNTHTTIYQNRLGTRLPNPYYPHTEPSVFGKSVKEIYSSTDYILTLTSNSSLTRVAGGLKAAGNRLDIAPCQPLQSVRIPMGDGRTYEARFLLMPLGDWQSQPFTGHLDYTAPEGQSIAGLFLLSSSDGMTVGPITFTP